VVVANLTTIMETHAISLCRISTRLHGQQAPPAIEFYRISCKVASQALVATGNREILNSKVTRMILIGHRPKRTSMPRHKLNRELTNRLQVINLVLPGGKTRRKSTINRQRSRNIRVSV
jgi:hypothetical protein